MFHEADKFFTDLGMIPMPQEFFDETMFTKPEDGREVVCHASAWDFYNQKDFRIKMCTTVTQLDFITIHHEMGHIEYFLQYKGQPVAFREGANPGFHEAVGDTLALSVSTLDHLYKVGLIDEPDNDADSDINYLMSIALDKLSFIPFGYLMDKYRWAVFSGEINEKNLNEGWWYDRIRYQGVTSPLPRSEDDFDAGSKSHIPNDVPYVRYFVSYVVQFQFYEAMCNAAGHEGDLVRCDFDGSKDAGAKLADMLKLGSSVKWEDALEQVTGSRKMSSGSLVRYFKPLLDYLAEENEKNGEVIGWPEYSWQPPTDTIVDADGKVLVPSDLPSGASGIISQSSIILSVLLAALANYFL
jgi:peptidyl-dipeptidase A